MKKLIQNNKIGFILVGFILIIFLNGCKSLFFSTEKKRMVVNYEQWRIDTMGCKGIRIKMLQDITELSKNKGFMKAVTLKDVIDIFGMPEYSYVLIKPGKLCLSYFYTECDVPENSCKGEYLYFMEPTVDFIFNDGILVSISNDAR